MAKKEITLTRGDFTDGIEHLAKAVGEKDSYLDGFSIRFPDGLNTANVLELCRMVERPDLEGRIRIARICIAGKNVEVTCPNGETESFCITNVNDCFDAFPLFEKEPLALTAIADSVYGYLLKKYIRLSVPAGAAAAQTR